MHMHSEHKAIKGHVWSAEELDSSITAQLFDNFNRINTNKAVGKGKAGLDE